jgi:HTH-type transcriptional regulator/antitoxin HigA
MKPKIIHTEAEYEAALARIDALMENDPAPGSPEGEELELLSVLVERYEDEQYPMDLPDPLSAIKFRMEQQRLKNKDLIPYIGSPSRVSEVLSGQRGLSLTMIRNLVNGLDIPAEALLGKPGAKLKPDTEVAALRKYPVAEMLKRGWFPGFSGTLTEAKTQLEDLFAGFVGVLGGDALRPALNRQHIRNGSVQDDYALAAWRIRVAGLALKESLPAYRKGTVTAAFASELARLSYLEAGPKLAREFLNKNGIHLIVERHLAGTHLDGAAIKMPDGSPLVALTLRYDRLDNFWFTLCHELAHIALHLDRDDVEAFYDDLDDPSRDTCEKEADAFAQEVLIPTEAWRASGLKKHAPAAAVSQFAAALRISPAIPAGRVRFERRNYMLLKDLLGNGQVRRLFPECSN